MRMVALSLLCPLDDCAMPTVNLTDHTVELRPLRRDESPLGQVAARSGLSYRLGERKLHERLGIHDRCEDTRDGAFVPEDHDDVALPIDGELDPVVRAAIDRG